MADAPEHKSGNNVQSVFPDRVFPLLASLAIVFWMIHEFIFDTHKLFLLIAIALGLADVFYVLVHKLLKTWKTFWWIVYAVCLVIVFIDEAPEPKSRPHFKFT